MYSYRDAQGNDFEQIVHFPQNEEELFFMFPRASYPLSVEELQECAATRTDATVFLCQGKVVGYANVIKVEGTNYGSVGNMIVAPNHRGKGLGQYILDTMASKLKENYSVKELRLACFSTNIAGLRLYQKYGLLSYEMEIKTDNKGNSVTRLRLKKEI